MAYLNAQERENLLNELKQLSFVKAKRRLFLADKQGRLAFFRNAQHSGKIETRFDLEGLGTRVTLIEKENKEVNESGQFYDVSFDFVEVIVEPLPGNRL